jgi:hypothetical protein
MIDEAEAAYKAASTESAELLARWNELRGPITPLDAESPVPQYTAEQVAAWEAANAAEHRLIAAFRMLAKAHGKYI